MGGSWELGAGVLLAVLRATCRRGRATGGAWGGGGAPGSPGAVRPRKEYSNGGLGVQGKGQKKEETAHALAFLVFVCRDNSLSFSLSRVVGGVCDHQLVVMKFGKNIGRVVELSDPEWSPFWINYKFLKKKAKVRA